MSDVGLSFYELQELDRMFKETEFEEILNFDQPCEPAPKPQVSEEQKVKRFEKVNTDEVYNFIQNQENENTRKKTVSDMKLFTEFCHSQGESRPIEVLPPEVLDLLFGNFIAVVKKPDNSEYEPSSIRGMVSSLDRYLRGKQYRHCVNKNPLFAHSNNSINAKLRFLKAQGHGSKPNASDELTDEDIEHLFECGELGTESPEQITNLLHLSFSLLLGMRGGIEQRNLKWGDIDLAVDNDGDEYLVHRKERQTKTRTGGDPSNTRKFKPKVWNVKDKPDRCPVKAYKIYRSQRPPQMNTSDAPFVLSINHRRTAKTHWFKNMPMGRNHIYGLVSNMKKNCSKINPCKKITNHSVRKHLMQKCNDLGMPANVTIQVSGHKNVASANNYSKLNDNQQKLLANAINQPIYEPIKNKSIVPQRQTVPTKVPTSTVTNDSGADLKSMSIQGSETVKLGQEKPMNNVSNEDNTGCGTYSFSQATSSTRHSDLQSIFCGTTTISGGTFHFHASSSEPKEKRKFDNIESYHKVSPQKYRRILPLNFSSDSDSQ